MNHKKTVATAKQQILEDVRVGEVPAGVADFSQLHDHADANYYGCLFEMDLEPATNPAHTEFINAVQGELDEWIKGGGITEALRVA